MIQNLLLFLLPTLLYAAYFSWARRRALATGQLAPAWAEGPWYWLVVSGALLVVLSLAALAIFGGAGPEAIYQPATLEDGKIVHGRVDE